ncbi:hypothetical protein H4R33_007188, partial [Dimargaris cristalligena]
LSTDEQLELIEQLGHNNLANRNALPHGRTSYGGVGYTQANKQSVTIDQATQGSFGTIGSYPRAEASGSGSGSGSLPLPATQSPSTQELMNQDTASVQQPQVPDNSRSYENMNSL